MSSKEFKRLAREVINKEKWWDMLSRFIDVLRINIFVVDHEGLVVLPPEERRYGGRLLTDRALKFDLIDDAVNIAEQFEPQGAFFESRNRYGLTNFAIPITLNGGAAIAYMIVGPLILNRRLTGSEYEKMADEAGCDLNELLNELGGIRVVSNIMVNSILALLSEIVRDGIELSLKEKELDQIKSGTEGYSKEVTKTAQEIYSTVYFDELLITLLDLALKMTNAECGSIMVKDAKDELTIKASRGIDLSRVQNVRIRPGDGVAGIAAAEDLSFMIHGTEGDARIKPYLSRPDIKEAFVMPLKDKDKVFGVLSLHTKQGGGCIKGNVDNLQYLSKLMSSAL